jgi:hypothetical protein
MPKLIVNRSGKRKVPPCGRLIKYVDPHSPFQKLVESGRRKQRLSGRQLAAKIVVDGKPLPQSTLWIWLHNENGFPHPKAFDQRHLRQLAKAIRVPIVELEHALDASRHLYTDRERPMPRESFDAFARFIDIIGNDRRKVVSRSYVENLARTLYNGEAASRAPRPDRSSSCPLARARKPTRLNYARSSSSRRPLAKTRNGSGKTYPPIVNHL